MITYAAYNAAPPGLTGEPALEDEWYALLRTEPRIGGLELGFDGTLHAGGSGRLAGLLDPAWRNTVTTMPGTLATLEHDPRAGLASTDRDARRRAVEDVRRLHAEVLGLQRELGGHAVVAAQLHSAPRTDGGSSAEALSDSLVEIAGWDWPGVRLLVEHSDATVAGHRPEKGWLSLDDEIRAVESATEGSGRAIGQSVNWGRSAIEARSAKGPVDHLERLARTGTLGAFTVSGVADGATPRGAAWADVHLAVDLVEPESLLTDAALEESLAIAASAGVDVIGIKVGADPAAQTLRGRLDPGLATLRVVHARWSGIRQTTGADA